MVWQMDYVRGMERYRRFLSILLLGKRVWLQSEIKRGKQRPIRTEDKRREIV